MLDFGFHLMDCMAGMAQFPDKFFELAIVDPPYGIGISDNPVRQAHKKKSWDAAIPDQSYFDELFRVSQNQIIWGGQLLPFAADAKPDRLGQAAAARIQFGHVRICVVQHSTPG